MTSPVRDLSLREYLDGQAVALTDRCTKCGRCVEVCPVVGADFAASRALKAVEPVQVISGVVDFLRGHGLPEAARTWIEACTGSGECIVHCPEHINPRQMLAIALTRVRAQKSSAGENPMGAYYPRMSQIIRLAVGLQMSPERYRRLIGRERDRERADVVFYLGCNVLRTPVIVFSVMDILDRLGVEYAMLGGVANCCGIIHLKLHGDVDRADVIGSGTLAKLAAFEPRMVLHWCPSCVMEFGETVNGYRRYPFEFKHVAHYLADRLDTLRPLLQPVPRRVALHRHDGGLGIADAVERLLGMVPGLELVPVDEKTHFAYTCGPGALSNLPDAREAAHRRTVESAVGAGADVLATLYHTCHRDLCVFEGQYPLEVKNWTTVLATALGLPEHEDRYKRIKLHREVSAILEDARDLIQAHGLDVSMLEEVLPGLLAGKERGMSVW
jgi:Fe-S oxidoreductase